MLLVVMFPVFVGKVLLVTFLLVMPVGAIFAIIPAVVVMVVRVVYANLNSGILRRRGRDGTGDCEGSRQEEPA